MDILQLRYFYDSANYLSISKTAKKYGVPATSVSASIRRLEEELDCRLFDRTPNRILLNEKGIIMRDSLKRIFNEMDSMLKAVSGSVDDQKEIKILVKAIRTLVTERVIEYKKMYTQTRFNMVTDFDERYIDDYDIIIDTQSDQYTGYDSLKLVKQQICCYAPFDSGLCKHEFSLKELSKMPFVLMSQHGNHGKIFIEACKKAGFTPNIVAQVNDSACFRKFISSGIAIGVIGQLATNIDENITLVPLNITDFKYEQTIYIYYKKSNIGNSARFVSFLHENIKNHNI